MQIDNFKIKIFVFLLLAFTSGRIFAGVSDTSKYYGGTGDGYALNNSFQPFAGISPLKYYGGAGDGYSLDSGHSAAHIELSTFSFSLINARDVLLKWRTESEIDNSGFAIERALITSDSLNLTWQRISFIESINSNTPVEYSYTDRKLSSGRYKYRLKQIDFTGLFEYYLLNSMVEIALPAQYNLSQNYPNPFNPSTKIDFDLPVESKVSLNVYDASGREVMKLADKTFAAGYYTIEFSGAKLSSGVYFYSLDASAGSNQFHTVKKMIMVK